MNTGERLQAFVRSTPAHLTFRAETPKTRNVGPLLTPGGVKSSSSLRPCSGTKRGRSGESDPDLPAVNRTQLPNCFFATNGRGPEPPSRLAVD